MFTCGPAFFAAAAGGGGGSGHRYWRLVVHSTTGGNNMDVSEIELRSSIGGADQTGSGTASSATGTAANAVDGNLGTVWSSSGGGGYPLYWTYDFGAGNEKDIVEIALAGNQSSMPVKFDLQWSDDNSSWTTLYEIAGETSWTTNAFRAFSASTDPDLYRYWRLYVTATNGHAYVSQQTIQMRESVGGSDIAAGNGNAIGNDNLFTLEPYRAFDSNNGTVWATNSLPGYCGKDFGASNTGWRTVVEWVLRADVATQAPKTFKLQKSHDATTWTDVITPADQTGWSVGEERTFS
jgi:hypothetical protein